LFSDHLVTIAGRSITITTHDMVMMIFSVVTGLLFWAALYFSRKRVVVLKGRAVPTRLPSNCLASQKPSSASPIVQPMMPLQGHRGVNNNRRRSESLKAQRIPCLGARGTIRPHSDLD
jgi:hypothetical protein